MALNVKHLNSDASFLLTFEPIIPESARGTVTPQPFTILLDPWITGPSKIFHPKISISTHKYPACVSLLADLPQTPDLVVISQHKSDHCNEATLRQLPPTGTKTLILAEPASARVIKGWKYFDREKIVTIENWKDPRVAGKQSVVRIPVPPIMPGGYAGEVTVAFIPQKRDLAGLHGAIAITYRSPSTHNLGQYKNPVVTFATPPTTPDSQTQSFVTDITSTTIPTPVNDTFLLPPTPPVSPRSLRSVKSASTLVASPIRSSFKSNHARPTTSSNSSGRQSAFNPNAPSRPISVIFSPHGISYSHIAPYATSHLVAEAAIPLTALLHCMDTISNPWWMGGNVCAGVLTGAEIATKLGAKIWVSAHDGEKDVRGIATGMLKTRRWKREEVEGAINSRPSEEGFSKHHARKTGHSQTEIMRLGSGDEVLVSADGVLWQSAARDEDRWSTASTIARVPSAPATTIDTNGHKHQESPKSRKREKTETKAAKSQDRVIQKKVSCFFGKKLRANRGGKDIGTDDDSKRTTAAAGITTSESDLTPPVPDIPVPTAPELSGEPEMLEMQPLEGKKAAQTLGIPRPSHDERIVRFEVTS